MTYAVIKCVNGNFALDSEWKGNINGAIMQWHNVCRTLWSAEDVNMATVEIIDELGTVLENYREIIRKGTQA